MNKSYLTMEQLMRALNAASMMNGRPYTIDMKMLGYPGTADCFSIFFSKVLRRSKQLPHQMLFGMLREMVTRTTVRPADVLSVVKSYLGVMQRNQQLRYLAGPTNQLVLVLQAMDDMPPFDANVPKPYIKTYVAGSRDMYRRIDEKKYKN